MVIGYNPSHSNVNSEVNAPFKILSLMLRYLDNEMAPKKAVMPKNRRGGAGGQEEESKETGGSLMAGYKMKRDHQHQNLTSGDGERLDTIDVGDDDDDDYKGGQGNFSDNDNEDEDQLDQEGSDVDSEDQRTRKAGADRIEVNLDDVNDEDDNEGLLKGGLLSSGPPGLFTIKESNDRGLADMETGSEVYMSELLVTLNFI